ncbi:hypothetical protein AVEN_65394-1 [Araneus ventricosus]|uniref:Uncharacterized protein n=1 Tax=Araneus ventricosus TaxID=182803 RepID=A0A4Y2NJQ4_ARAVE|nr:hypothetical protein AVEN_65394-1 [Araneus ventricosus]
MEERRKKKLKNRNAKKKLKKEDAETRNGSERMRWSLSCKKYVLKHKDDYDTLRSTFKNKQSRKEGLYDKRNSFKNDPVVTTNEKKRLYGITHNEIGFGNQRVPAVTIGNIKGDIEVDNVKGEGICIYIAPDDEQPVDLIIERTWLHLPHVAYAKIGKIFHIGQREDESFRNFRIDEKINRIWLEDLDTTKLEKESLRIRSSTQQMMNLMNDLKMVKDETQLLRGDIKNLMEERHSLLLQIQEKKSTLIT